MAAAPSPLDRSREQPHWPPLVIAVAPTGAHRGKQDHVNLPIEKPEIVATVAACREAGASMVHLHVRDRDGRHSLDTETYRDVIAAIRAEVGDGIIIQATSESVGIYSREQQMAMVREVRPEAVSMAIREIVPTEAEETSSAEFFEWLLKENITPQYILYSAEEVARFQELRRRGVIPGDAVFVLYVLGRYAKGQVSSPVDLLPFLEAAGQMKCHWGFCAFGSREGATAMMVTALGGHARIGFENNRWLNDGSLAPDNAVLVRQVAAGAELIARPIADAHAARDLLSHAKATDEGAAPPTSALAEIETKRAANA